MDQRNGNQQADGRSTSSPGPLLIILFILYLLLTGDSTPQASPGDIRDSLQDLRDEYSNYTAWLEDQPSNFTLNYESHAFANLRDSFSHPVQLPITTQHGHFNNITGTFKTKTVIFRNLTYPPKEVSWTELANAVYSEKNISQVHQNAHGWNWSQPMIAAVSISSYRSAHLPKNSTGFYRIKACRLLQLKMIRKLELHLPGQDTFASPSVELRHEGIHFPHDGSIIAVVEPKQHILMARSIMPDIRRLPAMVPANLENDTARMIAGQLKDRLSDWEKQASSGTLQLVRTDDPPTECSFVFLGYMQPIIAPREAISAYEKEIEFPSGIPLPAFGKPTFSGVLISEECGLALEFDAFQGVTDKMFNRRIFTYSAIASAVCYALIQLSLQISDQWRTTSNMFRGSRLSIVILMTGDIYMAVAHFMAAVMTTRTRYALLFPGILATILVATEVRLLTYLNGVQLVLHRPSPTPAPTVAPQTQAQASGTPNTSRSTENDPASPSVVLNISISIDDIRTFLITAINILYTNELQAWISTLILVVFVGVGVLGISIYQVWFMLLTSIWLGQITRNVFQRSRRVLRHDTIILSSIFRLFIPMYIFLCPDNLLNLEPTNWAPVIPLWVFLQTAVLIGQDYFGPTWFIPDIWNKENAYDYHPDLVKTDEESIESRFGDCSICMEPISADQDTVGVERGRTFHLWWKQAAKKRRVYAMAPCGHNFVRIPIRSTVNEPLKNVQIAHQLLGAMDGDQERLSSMSRLTTSSLNRGSSCTLLLQH
ncbi:hypothetical protein FRC17_000891 [Serendipita sp. 399]|nr:hypothetical protein FRC17_000891 [Serendipita sp. 399]